MDPDILPNSILGLSVFLDLVAFELVDFEWSKLPSLMCIALMKSTEDLNRIKCLGKRELRASLVAQLIKNTPANVRDTGPIPGSGRSPIVGNGNTFQYSCLENFHGQRSLAGYSPRRHKESDTTECLRARVRTHTHTHTHKRELGLPDCWAGTFIFSCLWTEVYKLGCPGSQAFPLRQDLHHQLSWVSSLPIAELGAPQHPQSCESSSYNKYYLYTCMC